MEVFHNLNEIGKMAEVKNLIEGLTDEILRVTEIQKEYDALPHNAGAFASALMTVAIKEARESQASGDIMRMIPALRELQEFEY
jgi:hypothetical protein